MLENLNNRQKEAIEYNITRLTKQVWKMIPMRENNELWEKQLETVIIEISGLNDILTEDAYLLQALAKLQGLKIVETSFASYRKTIFEVLNIMQEFKKYVK